jgi:hypothetical protein
MLRGHERIDQRSIALHAAIARRLETNPERWQIVRENLNKQLEMGGRSRPYTLAWQKLVDLPWEQLRQILVEDSEHMRAMRQCSPFAGVLDNRERWAIFDEYSLARESAK